jgi:hypothetical protein
VVEAPAFPSFSKSSNPPRRDATEPAKEEQRDEHNVEQKQRAEDHCVNLPALRIASVVLKIRAALRSATSFTLNQD